MKDTGFYPEVELVKMGNCPFCKEVVHKNDFKYKLSLREFEISRLYQKCQEVFG